MTAEEIKWKNYNEWLRKREFRKKLAKCYPDLGELAEMRHGIADMLTEVKGAMSRLPADTKEDDDEYLTLKTNKVLLTKVFNHINKDAQELFERYGVEDKCAES